MAESQTNPLSRQLDDFADEVDHKFSLLFRRVKALEEAGNEKDWIDFEEHPERALINFAIAFIIAFAAFKFVQWYIEEARNGKRTTQVH